MTIERVKAIAKEKCGKDLTDEQAAEYVAKHGKLADDELDSVAGGYNCYDSEYHKGKYCEPCGVWCDRDASDKMSNYASFTCPVCGTKYS